MYSTLAFTYNNKGLALIGLHRYEEALKTYEQAIHLDPTLALAHANKGETLFSLHRYKAAITCYDRALQLDAVASYGKGLALAQLKRDQAALASCWIGYVVIAWKCC